MKKDERCDERRKDEFVEDGEACETGEFVEEGEACENGEFVEDGETCETGEFVEEGEACENGEFVEDGEACENSEFTEDGETCENCEFSEGGEPCEDSKVGEEECGKKQSVFISKILPIILGALAVALCVAFVVGLYSIKIIPSKYTSIIVAVSSVLVLVGLLLMVKFGRKTAECHEGTVCDEMNTDAQNTESQGFSSEASEDRTPGILPTKEKVGARRMIGMILSAALVVALCFGNIYVWRTYATLKSIFSISPNNSIIYLAVNKDSEYEKYTDLEGAKISTIYVGDETGGFKHQMSEETLNILKGLSMELIPTEGASEKEVAQSLYNGSVEALCLNDQQIMLMSFFDDEFENKTRLFKLSEEEIPDTEMINAEPKSVNMTTEGFVVYLRTVDTKYESSRLGLNSSSVLLAVNQEQKNVLMSYLPYNLLMKNADNGEGSTLENAGIYGIGKTVSDLEAYLNVDINYYVSVNFANVEKLVNALGGVTVRDIIGFTTTDGKYTFPGGITSMDGAKAKAFADEVAALKNGVEGMAHNRRLLMDAILEKLGSEAVLANYSAFLESMKGTFETNMSMEDIAALLEAQLNAGGGWSSSKAELKGKQITITKNLGGTEVTMAASEIGDDEVAEFAAKIKAAAGQQ